MIYLPDTNACIKLLRQRDPGLPARWQAARLSDVVLCSVVIYELRHGAERSADPVRERGKLDVFLAPFASLPFEDAVDRVCSFLAAFDSAENPLFLETPLTSSIYSRNYRSQMPAIT